MHMVNDNSLVQYINTGNVLQDMRSIIEEELKGKTRAGYWLEIIKKLSKEPEIFHAASGKSGPLLYEMGKED